MNSINSLNCAFKGNINAPLASSAPKEAEKKEEAAQAPRGDSSKALEAQAKADIAIKQKQTPGIKRCNTSKLTGALFPEVDDLQITKNYVEFRQRARMTALRATKKLYKTFTTGQMNDYLDKKGRVVATFSKPDNPKGGDVYDYDTCSYKMTEYDPVTKEVKAITRVFNHDNFGKSWPKRHVPYMERIEFGKTPEETTFLRARFVGTEKDGVYTLSPKVELYAEGYETDGKLFGHRKADQYLSTISYDGYESYREDYEAPEGVFNGRGFQGYFPNETQNGGIEGEVFDRGLEYPFIQFKMGDNILTYQGPYVYED